MRTLSLYYRQRYRNNMTSLQHYQKRIHTALLARLPSPDTLPVQLHEAIHYTVFNGGKRLRPLLVYTAGETLGVNLNKLDTLACAVELIHTYSLIHDDLPAMDDDDWRRGKPSCHKAFNEATAILAGDALQVLAFECIACDETLSLNQRLHAIALLANASGSRGMVGGQMLDLTNTGQSADLAAIEHLYRLKTGALIKASLMMGVIGADITLSSGIAESFSQFADCISLAFQIQDDILDIEGSLDTLGKTPGSDYRHAKLTYAIVTGSVAAKEKVSDLHKKALDILNSLHVPVEPLQRIVEMMYFVR